MKLVVCVTLLLCSATIATEEKSKNASSEMYDDSVNTKLKRDATTLANTDWTPLATSVQMAKTTSPTNQHSSKTTSVAAHHLQSYNNQQHLPALLRVAPSYLENSGVLSNPITAATQLQLSTIQPRNKSPTSTFPLLQSEGTQALTFIPSFSTNSHLLQPAIASTGQTQVPSMQLETKTASPLLHSFGSQNPFTGLYSFPPSLPIAFSYTPKLSINTAKSPITSASKPQPSSIKSTSQQQQQQPQQILNYASAFPSFLSSGSQLLGQGASTGYQLYNNIQNPVHSGALSLSPSQSSAANLYSTSSSWPFLTLSSQASPLQSSDTQFFGSPAQPLTYFPSQQYGNGQLLSFPNSNGAFSQGQTAQQPTVQHNGNKLYSQDLSSTLDGTSGSGIQAYSGNPTTVKQPARVVEHPEDPPPYKQEHSTKNNDDDDEEEGHQKSTEYDSDMEYKPESYNSDGGSKQSNYNRYNDDDEDESKSSSYSKPNHNQYDNEDESKPSSYYKSSSSSYSKPANHRYTDDDDEGKSSSYYPRPSKISYNDESKPYYKTSSTRYSKPSTNRYHNDNDDYHHESTDSSDTSDKKCNFFKSPFFSLGSSDHSDESPEASDQFDSLKFKFSESFDHPSSSHGDFIGSPSESKRATNYGYNKKPYYSRDSHRSSSEDIRSTKLPKTLHQYHYKPPAYSRHGPVDYFNKPSHSDDSEGRFTDASPVSMKVERGNKRSKSYDWSYIKREILEDDAEEN